MTLSSSKRTAAPVIDFSMPTGLTPVDLANVVARESHDGELLADLDLSAIDLTSSSFVECELSGLTLAETQLRGARFVDTALSRSFASVLLAARSTWRRCRIENPRWGSAELFDAELDSVHVHGGKIDFLNLRGARLVNVLIEDCVITEIDLGGFQGNRVAFVNCRIDTLDLTRAECVDVDLRTSDFSSIRGIDGLRGATIDDLQLSLFASAFARQLGVRVE